MPCHNIFTDSIINSIYSSVTEPIDLNSSLVSSVCEDNDCINAKINIYSEGNEVARSCKRDYFRNRELISIKESYDKVAFHSGLKLNDDYMNKGIAKSIHNSELGAYKTHGFKEIQLDASAYGIAVWPRLFFEFSDEKSERDAIREFQKYLKQVWNYKSDTVVKKTRSLDGKIKKIPELYLKKNGDRISFGEWLSSYANLKCLSMYKVVA